DKLNEAIKYKKGQLIASIKEGQLVYTSIGHSSSYHLISVPNATVYKITLTDGTVVTLNSGSTLKYVSDFSNKSSRSVFLNGEAFFDVAKNKNVPFIVNTKDMHIKVLGTKFNVSSYNNDKNSSVVLEEGSVSINKKSDINSKSIILKPREQFVLEKDKFNIKPALVEKHIAWKKRKLHFSNDRFEDIIKEMERYYNLKINLNSSRLNNNRFTGTFTSETIEEVLNVFKELSEFKYTKKENTITIYRIK
ncbi:MAG: FecR family protein, partial [Flavobacteriaceae bacterium]|nr:FecR family protein [Flavobacteriaceae bacterium]